MNILLLYPYYNQKVLMQNFALKLRNYNIFVDFICVDNYTYERNSSIIWPFYIQCCLNYIQKSNVELLKRVFKRVSYRCFLGILFKKYDVVDFHAYYPRYNRLMRECVTRGVKFDITIWGSELMRANKEQGELLKYGFDRAYRLKMTENLHDVLVKSYGTIYDNKCRIVYFGNSGLSNIDSLSDEDAVAIKHKLYGDTNGKRVVVLGYNGSPLQNHDVMIGAINQLTLAEKDSIHVVLPMTYGAPQDYCSKIKKSIETTQISYTILDKFLQPDQVAAIRKTADIVVNIQESDALAGSLQDHLYCGCICIFGEWLNYSPYTNNGIYYIKSSKEGLVAHLNDVLSHFDKYHVFCVGNHNKVKSLFSWESTIKNQIAVYGE